MLVPCGDTTKLRYRSRKKALTALNYLRAHTDRSTVPCAVYRCRFCGDWHLTSQEQRAA
jgi:hypothetical protein